MLLDGPIPPHEPPSLPSSFQVHWFIFPYYTWPKRKEWLNLKTQGNQIFLFFWGKCKTIDCGIRILFRIILFLELVLNPIILVWMAPLHDAKVFVWLLSWLPSICPIMQFVMSPGLSINVAINHQVMALWCTSKFLSEWPWLKFLDDPLSDEDFYKPRKIVVGRERAAHKNRGVRPKEPGAFRPLMTTSFQNFFITSKSAKTWAHSNIKNGKPKCIESPPHYTRGLLLDSDQTDSMETYLLRTQRQLETYTTR